MKWKEFRRFVQVGIILLFMLPLFGATAVIGNLSSSSIWGIVLTDPLATLEVVAASKGVTVTLILSTVPVLLMYLVVGKAFCAWICPIGLIVEAVSSLRVNNKRVKVTQNQYYYALPLILVGSLLVSIPLFQMVSPMNILFRSLVVGLGIEVFILIVIVCLEVAGYRRGWCRLVCPLGNFYAILGRFSPLTVKFDDRKCVKCRTCFNNCDHCCGALEEIVLGQDAQQYVNSALCTKCGQCLDVCPTKALCFTWKIGRGSKSAIDTNRTEGKRLGVKLSRRKLLQASGVFMATGTLYAGINLVGTHGPKVFRPPGAGPEEEFLARCIRCGKCIQICPEKTLLIAHADQGFALGTPYFRPREQPCSLCMECPPVCPSGALEIIDVHDVKIGTAVVNEKLCYAHQGDICRSCYNNCPLIDEAIYMEEFQYPVIVTDKCTGCGICEYVCVMEEPAIKIEFYNG